MKTIKDEVREVYKTSNNNASFNKNIYNFNRNLNSIPNLGTAKNKNNNNSLFKRQNMSIEQINKPISQTTYTNTIIFVIIGLLIVIVSSIYFFKDQVIEFIKPFFEKEEKDDQEHERDIKEEDINNKDIQKEDSKENEDVEKTTKNDFEEVNKLEKTEKSKHEKGIIKSEKSNLIQQQYSSSQIMKEDGYCYIGSDNNMRHCVNAYSGDVCTSGDMYKRIDDCLMPKISQENCGH